MKKNIQLALPDGLELVGVYKFKDKEGRRAIRIKITGDVRELIIQKVEGESNKMIVAVKKGEYEYSEPKIVVPEGGKKIILPNK